MDSVQHTLHIFEQLVQRLPPLVPDELAEEARDAYKQCRANLHLSVEELENTMVHYAKQLWPYREAFLEFMRVAESTVGEQSFMKKLSPSMKKKYRAFLETGGTFRDFHAGKDLSFFTPEQRQELCVLLLEVNRELWDYTVQRVLGIELKRYSARIEEFKTILVDVENRIAILREMAEAEEEHPELAVEIREHARGFEHSIALLGPRLDYEAVCNSLEHIDMRRKQKYHHRHTTPVL